MNAPAPWRVEILAAATTALWGSWLLSAFIAGSISDVFDLTKLIGYPLHRRALVASMFAGSLLDFATMLTVPVFISLLIVWGKDASLLFAIVALMVLLAHMVTGYQLVATSLSGVFHSRRLRDIVLVLGMLGALLIWSSQFWGGNVVKPIRDAYESGVLSDPSPLDVLQWIPPGAIARAIGDAAQGNVVGAFGWLAYSAAFLPPFLWVWWRAVVRVTVQGGQLFVSRGRVRDGTRVQARARRIPRTPLGALFIKEWKIWWRMPRLRIQMVQCVVMPAVFAFLMLQGGLTAAAMLFTPAVCAGVAAALLQSNVLGAESGGIATLLISPVRRATIVRAKTASFISLIGIPYVIGAVTIIVVAPGVFATSGALSGFSILAVASTVFGYTSTRFPFALPDDARAGTVRGPNFAHTLLGSLLAVTAILVTASPVLVPLAIAALLNLPALALGTALFGAGYGTLVFFAGTKFVAQTFTDREMEIYKVLKP
jgi:ABC-2 type transport system permease protein